MGINFLRSFLESLCCNSPWDYALFWKLRHQNEMDLVWEDGFCDILRDPMVSPVEDLYLEKSNKTLFSTFSSSVLDGTPVEYPVGLAVSEMSSASHILGKGVVGKAAFTGNARWIYSDNIATDMFNSVVVPEVPEYPDEWLIQFAAGIKTVLILPVIPHGVLQLGSVEMVAEDAALAAYVKDKFEAYRKSDPNDLRYSAQQFPLLSTFMENLEEPSDFFTEKQIKDQNDFHAVRTEDCSLIANQIMPFLMNQDFCNTSVRWVTDTPENVTESEFSRQPLGMIHVTEPCQLSSENYKGLLTENDILQYFHHEENLRASSYCDKYDRMMDADFMNELMDFHFEDGATEPTFLGNDFDSATCESGNNFFSSPGHYELRKTLGTAVEDDTYQYTNGTSISGHDAACRSIGDREPSYSIDVSGMESIEHLLEAVVANIDDNSSNNSNITSLDATSGQCFPSSEKHDHSKHSASLEEDKSPWNFLTSEIISHGINTVSSLSVSLSSVESKTSTLSDKQQPRKGSANPGKLSRLSTNKKRKTRPGDNRRPRPRDRQLIQDRIKELRELVPNSEKCSIDGLLDKTIKHMLFLQNVTNQADKLRQHVSKDEADEKMRTAEVKYSHQNGTSWAVELGSEQQLCPIVVKDLDQPGHMLIEMLCGDHGHFLEISDAIHRLQLTILKGVLEKTTDNSWARFVVETSGNFHRLDIFWPLMQLLQQSRVPISNKI